MKLSIFYNYTNIDIDMHNYINIYLYCIQLLHLHLTYIRAKTIIHYQVNKVEIYSSIDNFSYGTYVCDGYR